MYLIKPSQVGNDKKKKMKEKHESRQRNPLKYVKLVSSNEGNGKKREWGEGKFLLKEKEKEVTIQKDSH